MRSFIDSLQRELNHSNRLGCPKQPQRPPGRIGASDSTALLWMYRSSGSSLPKVESLQASSMADGSRAPVCSSGSPRSRPPWYDLVEGGAHDGHEFEDEQQLGSRDAGRMWWTGL